MENESQKHIPVLLNEVIEYLNPKPGQTFIDCTLGGGGHTLSLAERISPEGEILSIDLDKEAIERFNLKIKNQKSKIKIILVQGNFKDLKKIAYDNRINKVNGILLDMGLSSHQLGDPERGFSFQTNGPLKMCFDQDAKLNAEEIVNSWSRDEIEKILRLYGEERHAIRIAKAIYIQRKKKRIKTTGELIEIIRNAVPRGYLKQKIHFATRTFQALRIAVNDELGNLEKVLPQAIELLEKGGRLAVISFHSLEDRIVKQYFRQVAKTQNPEIKLVNKKVIIPSFEERKINPRSRSAKMRVIEKIRNPKSEINPKSF